MSAREVIEVRPAAKSVVVVQDAPSIVEVVSVGPQGPASSVLPAISFAFGDASPRTVYTPTQDVLVLDAEVIVDAAFNGASPSLSLSAGAVSLMPSGLNDLALASSYSSSPDVRVNAGTPFVLSIAPGAGATQGAGKLVLNLLPA